MNKQDIDEFGLDDKTPGGAVKETAGKYQTLRKGGKKAGELSARMKHARELFMFGNGDGKPVRNVGRLAQKSGCSVSGIEKWINTWQRESEQRAVAETGGRLALVPGVTDGVVQWHRSTVADLKEEIDKVRVTMKKLVPSSDLHIAATKQLALLLKQWETSSGFADHVQTAVTAQRELLKQAARLQGRNALEKSERQATAIEFQ